MAKPPGSTMEKIVALCKRRGFIFQSSEIYGGINGFWDYGPLGVELKRNVMNAWWDAMVHHPPLGPDGNEFDMVGLETSIIMHPQVWKASGHYDLFSDMMVDCRECKGRFRADHVSSTPCPMKPSKMAGEHDKCQLTEPREFNLMFESYAGAIKDDENKVFLRPETAQGMFLNFKNVVDTSRVKLPFGIAQMGKSFRNEITPRNFIFRSREFEQMEMEWFCHPSEAPKWFEFWQRARLDWWRSLGIDEANLIMRQHESDELSHYAKAGCGTADVEYRYPFTAPGFGELEGVAHRTDFDLRAHHEHSGAKLEYFDQERNERYFPHVIEPASGLSRGVLVLLCEAFTPDDSRPSKVFMKFPPELAPIKAAVYPLVNKDGMPEVAQKLHEALVRRFGRLGMIEYDPKQSIGKRYARMDEAGCPYCFTVDGDTLQDQTVTVRHRDTQEQERIGIDAVPGWLGERLGQG